jgi:hypothetical protein
VSSPAVEGVAAAVSKACGVPEPLRLLGAPDWPDFLRLVDRHQVAALVVRSGWLDEAGVPPEVRHAVRERARSEALRSLRLLALQREVLDALTGAGVAAVVLKGAPLAIDAHGDPSARACRDIDLLVSEASVPGAVRALRSAGLDWYGWTPPEDPDRPPIEPLATQHLSRLPMLRDVTLARDGLPVEVHWRLFPNARLMPVDPDWVDTPRHVDIHGLRVPTLPLRAQWLYVLVHGTNHLWSRMNWLADVPSLALRHPELVRPDALARADARYNRSLASGLIVAEAIFGRFLPPESRAWASSVDGTGLLVRRSLQAIAADHDRPKRVSPAALPSEVLTRLSLSRDARYRLDELRLLLLLAGRAQGVEDPGLVDLVAGPLSWTRRSARRLRGRRAAQH